MDTRMSTIRRESSQGKGGTVREEPPWFTYIIRCSDNTLYTGIARNLLKRIDAHNTGNGGAKYTRTRRPVSLVYQETFSSRSEAAKREYQLKKMTRMEKDRLVESKNL